jgi:CBS-domain-containing membrane protein
MKVEKIMQRCAWTCGAEDSLNTAAQIMWENDCGCVPVIAGERIVGMITDRDVCMAAFLQGKPLRDLPVALAMAKSVRTCKTTDSVAAVEEIMRSSRIRRLPVVDDGGALVGLISLSDIAVAAGAMPVKTRKGALSAVGDTLAAICHRPPTAAAKT